MRFPVSPISVLALGMMAIAVAIASCERPSGEETSSESVPDAPPWAVELVGQPLRARFTSNAECVGNPKDVQIRYTGDMPGMKIVGWAWHPGGNQPPPRILLVDSDYKIVGAGETGQERPDVPKARPEITSSKTGFWAVTKLKKGGLDVFGVIDDKTVCKVGHIDL